MKLRRSICMVTLAFAAVWVLTGAGAVDVKAPDFALRGADGRTVRLSNYTGKVVVVNFWATYCGGCVRELPWLIELETKYRSRGLIAIGISLDEEGWKAVRPFLKQKPISFPVVVGDEAVAAAYGVDAIPLTVLVDRRGRVVWSHAGVFSKEALDEKIRETL
jgi:peroxiredoxin